MVWGWKGKYPEVPIGTLPGGLKPLAAFNGVIWYSELYSIYAGVSVLAGVLSFFAVMTENMWIDMRHGELIHWLMLFIILLTPILVGLVAWRLLLRAYRKALERSDQRATGPVTPGSLYLGVSFCDGVWKVRNHQSWSKGFLAVEDEGIVFDAWAGGFMLPYEMIREVRIGIARTILPASTLRLFIKWRHPSGRMNTLSFENLRSGDSAAIFESLKERLLLKLPGAELPGFDERALPLESSAISFPNSPPYFQSYFVDRVLAFMLMCVTIVPAVALEQFLARFVDRIVIHVMVTICLVIAIQMWADKLIFCLTEFRRNGNPGR